MADTHNEEHAAAHHNQDCIGSVAKNGLIFGGIGLVVSAFQNASDLHTRGAMGVFTRTGGTIGFFAAMGGIFAGAECAASAVRGKDDMWNSAIAGCAAGVLAGVRAHSFATMCGACAAIGGTMAAYEYGGANIKGALANMTEEQKKKWRESFFKQSAAEKNE
ncbi:uncharacterized protein VTP21DRAFT_3647 [Calcarisporiella thermophila]|uniref:uncharacterized protein n=1 Tax=Calcarisporiella thermophila TaxID=911321 RepID=UPI003742E81D